MEHWSLKDKEWIARVEVDDKSGGKVPVVHVRPKCTRCALQGLPETKPPVRKTKRKSRQRWKCENSHWFETSPLVIHKSGDGWTCRPCPTDDFDGKAEETNDAPPVTPMASSPVAESNIPAVPKEKPKTRKRTASGRGRGRGRNVRSRLDLSPGSMRPTVGPFIPQLQQVMMMPTRGQGSPMMLPMIVFPYCPETLNLANTEEKEPNPNEESAKYSKNDSSSEDNDVAKLASIVYNHT